MTFFCSKFARKALFFKSEKGFLLCIPEGCVMMDRDNRQMKADYTTLLLVMNRKKTEITAK